MTKSLELTWSASKTNLGTKLINSCGHCLCIRSTPCPTRELCSSTPSRSKGLQSRHNNVTQTISTETVLITIEEAAHTPHVPFHTCVEDVVHQCIPHSSALKRGNSNSNTSSSSSSSKGKAQLQQGHQLQEEMYIPQLPSSGNDFKSSCNTILTVKRSDTCYRT